MEIGPDVERLHYSAQGRLARMQNYYRWILRQFDGALGKRIWDAGAGIGTVSEMLAEHADFLLASEFTEQNLVTLRERFGGRERIRVERCDLTKDDALAYSADRLDTIVSLDVLEHLEDDRLPLRLFHQVLAPGGKLCLKVPAHPFLYGTLDRASLHHRRYTRRDLGEKLRSAGFTVERLRAMNFAATIPYFLKGRVLKRDKNFSNTIDGSRLGLYNRLVPWLERVERWLPIPVGLSLVAIARKT
jgi:SAM-dependent methyltransferase